MSEIQHEWLAPYFTKDSRRKFFSLASKVAAMGAVGATGISLAQTTGTTGTAASAAQDLAVLNYALTLEYLEATFYTYFLGVTAIPTSGLPAGITAPSSYSGILGTVNRVSPVEQSQMVGRGLAPLQASAFGSSLLLSSALGSALGVGSNLYNLLAQIRDHEVTHVIVLKQVIQSLGGTPVQPCDYNFPVTSADTFLQVAQALENTGVSAYDGAINMVTNPAIVQAGATIATVEARHASFLNLIAGGGFAANGSFQPSTRLLPPVLLQACPRHRSRQPSIRRSPWLLCWRLRSRS